MKHQTNAPFHNRLAPASWIIRSVLLAILLNTVSDSSAAFIDTFAVGPQSHTLIAGDSYWGDTVSALDPAQVMGGERRLTLLADWDSPHRALDGGTFSAALSGASPGSLAIQAAVVTDPESSSYEPAFMLDYDSPGANWSAYDRIVIRFSTPPTENVSVSTDLNSGGNPFWAETPVPAGSQTATLLFSALNGSTPVTLTNVTSLRLKWLLPAAVSLTLRDIQVLPPVSTTTFTTNATIAAGDATYDGQAIIVSNCTLTVNGPHAFASMLLTNGAVLTHATAPNGELLNRLDLVITGDLTVSADSQIPVNGRGYGSGRGPGAGGNEYLRGSGAGHGGWGGNGSGGVAGGGHYGGNTLPQPTFPGSGGGAASGTPGGAGGGAVHLIVGGTLTVGGVLSANGGAGQGGMYPGAGGSGGSLWIEAGTLAGNGTISANGGAGLGSSGGGAGGRIALHADTDSFVGLVTAFGGAGFANGGAGTVFRQLTGEPNGRVLVDNDGQAWQFTWVTSPTAFDLTISHGGCVLFSNELSLVSLTIGTNGLLRHSGGMTTNATIHTTSHATIASGGRLNLNELGHPTASGPGAGVSEYLRGSGAGHGGWGGNGSGNGVAGGGHYGGNTLPQPTFPGSGGGAGSGTPGGAGGGAVHLIVGGTLTVGGVLSANGGAGQDHWQHPGAGGSGGSLWIEAGTLAGNGTISANGGAGLGSSGGGAGGRIALHAGTDSFVGLVTAFGGTGFANGGAGTVFRQLTGEPNGRVLVDNGGQAFTWTPVETPEPYALTLAGSARGVPTGSVLLSSLRVQSGTTLFHHAGLDGVDVAVTGDATVDLGGVIDVTGLGYGTASGPGTGTNGYLRGSGAGHGGRGGDAIGGDLPGGVDYGVSWWPTSYGSGGGKGSSDPGGAGGGRVHLVVGGQLTVNGSLLANGNDGITTLYAGGGGSGGAILIEVGSLVGGATGLIAAKGGGANTNSAGGGSGGRIAIYQNGGNTNLWPAINVTGGPGFDPGDGGTVFISTAPAPLRVATHVPAGTLWQVVSNVQVVFQSAVSATSFTADDVVITTPSGTIPPGQTTVTPLGAALFQIGFPPQSAPGSYGIQVGPQVSSLHGMEMDQNGNGTVGEIPADVYNGAFVIERPTLSGTVTATNGWRLKHVTVRALDGSASTVTDADGNYTLSVAPGWVGTVAAELGGGSFTPASRNYTALTAPLAGQNYQLTTTLTPAIQTSVNGNSLMLSWPTIASLTYQRQSATNLSAPVWLDWGAPIIGTGGVVSTNLSITVEPQRFFRLQINE